MKYRPCSKLGHLGQKFRPLGQIIENHIVHKGHFSTPMLITLRSRFQSFEILHQSYMLNFLRAIIAKPDDGSGSYLA